MSGNTTYFALSTCLSLTEAVMVQTIWFAGMHLLHHVALQLAKRLCTAKGVILGWEYLPDRAAKKYTFIVRAHVCVLFNLIFWYFD